MTVSPEALAQRVAERVIDLVVQAIDINALLQLVDLNALKDLGLVVENPGAGADVRKV